MHLHPVADPSREPADREQYREHLQRNKELYYQSLYAGALHSDRITGDIGIFALKVVLILNGAALLGLLGAFPSFTSNTNASEQLLAAGGYYLCGVLAAALAVGVAYLYQSFVTGNDWDTLREASDMPPANPWIGKGPLQISLLVTVLLAFTGYGLFGHASFRVLRALEIYGAA